MIELEKFLRENYETLEESEKQEIINLLSAYDKKPLSMEQLCKMVDEVWDGLGCDNKQLDWEKIGNFYNHPIWIVNGLFIEQNEMSMNHRQAIACWISLHKKEIKNIIDYGGGMGTLAKIVAQSNCSDNSVQADWTELTPRDSDIKIDIYEPFPSKIAIKKLEKYSNIQFIDRLENRSYDCLISTDVLEHLSDPLLTFSEMISHVRVGGYLIMVNCFYPLIKCHLPQHFHLRYTFKLFARMMGLKVIGRCEGSWAIIYQKEKDKMQNWQQIRTLETTSKLMYPFMQIFYEVYQGLRGTLGKKATQEM